MYYMYMLIMADGTVYIGDREQIARELNFSEDVYDDEVWDKFCSYYTEERATIHVKEDKDFLEKMKADVANCNEEDDMPF